MFPTTQERRRSWNTLTPNEGWRPRSASTGVIEISPFSRNLSNSQRSPATPCFVSPRMAFSTQFNYDSPIQVLTSSSPCVFKPMSVRNLKRRCSLRKLPPRCKILLIVLCLSLAGSLYFIRSLKEANESYSPSVEEYRSDPSHDHPSLQRFLGTVNEQPHYHSLTQDLDNPQVEMPNAPSLNPHWQHSETADYQNSQAYSAGGAPSEAEHQIDSYTRTGNTQNKLLKVNGVYAESNHQENPVNTSAHPAINSLFVLEQNSLDVKSITTLEDLPLVQQETASMHERERRDLYTENPGVRQDDNAGFHTGHGESSYTDPKNDRGEETVNYNTLSGKSEAIHFPSSTQEESLKIHPQGENSYFYPQNGNQMGNPLSGPPRSLDETSNFQHQFVQSVPEGLKPQLSEREIEARLTRHYIPKENSMEESLNSFDRMYQEGRPMPMGYRAGEMPLLRNEPLRYDGPHMERLPPGVNPRRYRNEF